MKGFLICLTRCYSRRGGILKLAHLVNWIKTTADPDRGYGLAALTSDLSFRSVKAGVVRELAGQVTDPDLFALSYDFVGDLAETVALLWPDRKPAEPSEQPSLSQIITTSFSRETGSGCRATGGLDE